MVASRCRVRVALVAALLALPACTGDEQASLTVLAATSLAEAFDVIARDFEAQHDIEVRVGTAGSQQLATQVLEGAPADVFASADRVQMERVVDAGLAAGPPEVLAHDTLAIAVHPDGPAVTSPADLARPGVDVVLAAPEVPVGRYARQALDALGLAITPVTLASSARAVLSRVALGEADAGIVYASDLVSTDNDVGTVPMPDDLDVPVDLPIVALQDAGQPELAAAFIAHVRSPTGRARLRELGFRVEEDPS